MICFLRIGCLFFQVLFDPGPRAVPHCENYNIRKSVEAPTILTEINRSRSYDSMHSEIGCTYSGDVAADKSALDG